jgi:hypothetical protein
LAAAIAAMVLAALLIVKSTRRANGESALAPASWCAEPVSARPLHAA